MPLKSMRRSAGRARVLRCAESLEPRVLLAAVFWDGEAGNGEWSDPLNWSNNALPGPDDDVTIDLPGGNVSLSTGSHAVNSLVCNTNFRLHASLSLASASTFFGTATLDGGGVLTGAGDITINGTLRQIGTNSSLAGTGQTILTAGSGFEVAPTQSPGSMILSRPLTINAGASLRYTPMRQSAAGWRWIGAQVTNHGLFTVAPIAFSNEIPWFASFGTDAQCLLINHGTIHFATPPAVPYWFTTWQLRTALENHGTFQVGRGAVQFDNSTVANHGIMRAASIEARLSFPSTSTEHFSGASIEGPGALWLGGPVPGPAHVFAADTFNPIGEVSVASGTIELNQPFTGFTLVDNTIGLATMVFNTPQTLDSLNLSRGSIRGPGDVTFTGNTAWGGNGTIAGPGRRILASGATMMMNVGAGTNSDKRLEATLEVFGTVNRSGASLILSNGKVHIKPGGQFIDTVAAQSDTPEIRADGGSNAFINEGTFTKAGTAPIVFPATNGGIAFNNSGQTNVNIGIMEITHGGTNSGQISIAAGAMLFHTAPAYVHTPGSSLNGPGRVSFGFGEYRIGAVNGVSWLLVAESSARALFNGPISMPGGELIAFNGALVTLRADARVARLVAQDGGRIDLTDRTVIIDYAGATPLPEIRAGLTTGYNGGTWDGAGIFSTVAAAHPNHALGYAEATELFSTFPATFNGQTIDDSTVIVRYTRWGDANLDRVVNLEDFNRLAAGFGQIGTSWARGNFNYDNATNLADFNLLASNFGAAASTTSTARTTADDLIDSAVGG